MDFEDHIDRYLLDEMSESDRADFEATVHSEKLEQKVQERRLLIQGVRYSERKKIKEKLATLEQSLNNSSKTKAWRWIAAASVAAVILSSVWFGLRSGDENFYQAYFEPYPNYEQPIIRGEETISPYTLYERRDYGGAIEMWAGSTRPEDTFYQAVAQLATDNSEKAIELLEALPGDHKYQEQANWYLALAYIKNKDYASAKPLLDRARFEDFKPKDAKALLRSLP